MYRQTILDERNVGIDKVELMQCVVVYLAWLHAVVQGYHQTVLCANCRGQPVQTFMELAIFEGLCYVQIGVVLEVL